jgi:hypothetical protein
VVAVGLTPSSTTSNNWGADGWTAEHVRDVQLFTAAQAEVGLLVAQLVEALADLSPSTGPIAPVGTTVWDRLAADEAPR